MFYANTFTLKMENKKMATKALEVMKEALAQVNADGFKRVRKKEVITMTAITINAKNRSIELTKTFATASSKFGTPEYDQLQQVRKDYPTYKVVTVTRKAPKNSKPTFKGLTYEYMEKYIMGHDDNEQTIMNECTKEYS